MAAIAMHLLAASYVAPAVQLATSSQPALTIIAPCMQASYGGRNGQSMQGMNSRYNMGMQNAMQGPYDSNQYMQNGMTGHSNGNARYSQRAGEDSLVSRLGLGRHSNGPYRQDEYMTRSTGGQQHNYGPNMDRRRGNDNGQFSSTMEVPPLYDGMSGPYDDGMHSQGMQHQGRDSLVSRLGLGHRHNSAPHMQGHGNSPGMQGHGGMGGMQGYGQRPGPPQGYGQQMPPQGYGQQMPPQGYGQQMPPQGYGRMQGQGGRGGMPAYGNMGGMPGQGGRGGMQGYGNMQGQGGQGGMQGYGSMQGQGGRGGMQGYGNNPMRRD